MPKLLFVLKQREGNWGGSGYSFSKESGLSNSVRFLVDMLTAYGVEAKMVQVEDNNAIDREVSLYKPTHAVIEAFWVVPEKFDVLMPLHPKVSWVVRDHSETSFLANEGIAFGWTAEYLKRGIEVMCNSPSAMLDMASYALSLGLDSSLVSYGPNFYPLPDKKLVSKKRDYTTVNVGCFGAIRPLKNHMIQAIAAMMFAQSVGAKLRFHINATRVEGNADPILKNLREAFKHSKHELVEHGWMPHADFIKLLEEEIDISMQVSFTETFNIVAADAMYAGVPVVCSNAVPWIGSYAHRDVLNSADIYKGLYEIWSENEHKRDKRLNDQKRDMDRYTAHTIQVWIKRFGNSFMY